MRPRKFEGAHAFGRDIIHGHPIRSSKLIKHCCQSERAWRSAVSPAGTGCNSQDCRGFSGRATPAIEVIQGHTIVSVLWILMSPGEGGCVSAGSNIGGSCLCYTHRLHKYKSCAKAAQQVRLLQYRRSGNSTVSGFHDRPSENNC